MKKKETISFEKFAGLASAAMANPAEKLRIRETIGEQAHKLVGETDDDGWKNWLQQLKDIPCRPVCENWPVISRQTIYDLKSKGAGSEVKVVAIYYRLHFHTEDLKYANAVDPLVFGEEQTYASKHGEPVFIEVTDEIEMASEEAPFKHPPYVYKADLLANDVDEAVWLNPHNHYSIPLKGREKEQRLLKHFVESPEPFLIWALIGPSGAGKTRLVSEFMKTYVATDTQKYWDAGFVRSRVADVWTERNWRLSRNTLIVVDYTYNYGEVMKAITERCRALPDKSPKVRLLIVDHTYPKDLTKDSFWQQFFTDRFEDFQRSKSNPNSKQKYLFKDTPIHLAPEPEESNLLKHVIVAAANSGGKNSYTIEDERIKGAERQLHRMGERAANPGAIKHPLFAALMGQAILNNVTDFNKWTRRDLIENYFTREHRLPWCEDAGGINRNPETGKWAGAIVAAATLARGSDVRSTRKILRRYVHSKKEREDIFDIANRLLSSSNNFEIRPLEPDILGDSFILKFLEVVLDDDELLPAFIEMIVYSGGKYFEEDLSGIFFEVIRRIAVNLAHENQLLEDVRSNWRNIFYFLEQENFSEYREFEKVSSVFVAENLDRLNSVMPVNYGRNWLIGFDRSVLYSACRGRFWYEALTASLNLCEKLDVDADLTIEFKGILGALKPTDTDPKLMSGSCFSPLNVAISRGYLGLAKQLVALGYDPCKPYGCANARALEAAAVFGDVEMMDYFFSIGVPIENPSAMNPVYTAVLGAAVYSGKVDAVEWVLGKGARSSDLPFNFCLFVECSSGFEPVHLSLHPLIVAAQNDYLDIFRRLYNDKMDFGSEVSVGVMHTEEDGRKYTKYDKFCSLLEVASASGSWRVLCYLLGRHKQSLNRDTLSRARKSSARYGVEGLFHLAWECSNCFLPFLPHNIYRS